MSKNNRNTIDLIPYQKKPYQKDFDCKAKEELKVDKYNVTIDSDPVDNLLYLELGYDNKEEYSSAFFISPEDAYTIGRELQERAMRLLSANREYSDSKYLLDLFKERLANNNIKELHYHPIKLYTEDVDDTLFGRMISELSYITKDGKEESFKYLTDQMQGVDKKYLYNLVLELENKNIDVIDVNINGFEFLWGKIKLIREKWLNKNKKKDTIKTMTPKESLYKSIQNTIEKMNESKPSK